MFIRIYGICTYLSKLFRNVRFNLIDFKHLEGVGIQSDPFKWEH